MAMKHREWSTLDTIDDAFQLPEQSRPIDLSLFCYWNDLIALGRKAHSGMEIFKYVSLTIKHTDMKTGVVYVYEVSDDGLLSESGRNWMWAAARENIGRVENDEIKFGFFQLAVAEIRHRLSFVDAKKAKGLLKIVGTQEALGNLPYNFRAGFRAKLAKRGGAE
jgi:hypothetical protein